VDPASELVLSDQQHSLRSSRRRTRHRHFLADEFPPDEEAGSYVLKPLYSFAGLGVEMDRRVKKSRRRKSALLDSAKESRVRFVCSNTGRFEIKSGAAVIVSFGRKRANRSCLYLVRMSQGK